MNELILQERQERLHDLLEQLQQPMIDRGAKWQALLSWVDATTHTKEGLQLIFDHIILIDRAGVFEGTPWEDPKGLIAYLVKGTLCASPPSNVLELLSELRMLKIAIGEYDHPKVSKENAADFLEDVLVNTFDLAYRDLTEQMRINVTTEELYRIKTLFDFILVHFSPDNLKAKLAREVATIADQRPILTHRLEALLGMIRKRIDLDPADPIDQRLLYYIDALFHPTQRTREEGSVEDYLHWIESAGDLKIRMECEWMGQSLQTTGLVSEHQYALLKYLAKHQKLAMIPDILQLNAHGKAEFDRHHDLVLRLISDFLLKTNKQVIYGLKKILERTLLSRRPVWNALQQLMETEIHPKIATNLHKSSLEHKDTPALQLLVGGTISVLGQPLGIGQGNNPTCQSARGISMWSQQAPAKLLNMITHVAYNNMLDFRYEGALIESNSIEDREEDYYANLAPVSVVLVPHLDHIYGQMMQKALVKHAGMDPHISVNPAFYGHWIQTGFASCYNTLLGAVKDYDTFVRTFYASFHPAFNGGHHLVYPVPVGIFITSSRAEFLGFHAISLLRVVKDEQGEYRAYFFNPNNEGRQNWGQGIKPTVAEHGERHGESSLPVHHFVSRVYAFHYNTKGAEEARQEIPTEMVEAVTHLAKESWGKKYVWL